MSILLMLTSISGILDAHNRVIVWPLQGMYFEEMWPLEDILPLMTSTPAELYKFRKKGSIAPGMDADVSTRTDLHVPVV